MIVRLPVELIIQILENLDATSIVSVRTVCTALRDIVNGSCWLQYLIELERRGQVDVPVSAPMTPADRLRLLVAHSEAWSSPQWRKPYDVPMFLEGSTYELQGGLFVSGRPSPFDTRYTRSLCFRELPWRNFTPTPLSVAETPRVNTWNIEDLGFEVHDFQVDPSQDLLILVEKLQVIDGRNLVNVHIRTASDNTPHPETVCPVHAIELPRATHPNRRVVVLGYIIQVMDNVIGILTCFRETGPEPPIELSVSSGRVDIINWQSGQAHASIEASGIDSLVFLDQETMLLPRRVGDPPRTMSLDVYRFNRTEKVDPPPKHRSSNFPMPSQGVQPIARLEFPKMPDAPGTITTIIARCEPGLSFRTKQSTRCPKMIGPTKSFRPSQSGRIISLTFATLQPVSRPFERQFCVILLAESIRKLAAAAYDATRNPLSRILGVDIPWEQWGRLNTTWLEIRMTSNWICYAYGTRFTYLDSASNAPKVVILDFNTHAVRSRGRWDIEQTQDSIIRTVDWFPPMTAGTTWTEPIFFSLPYVQITSQPTFRHAQAVMLDDERIILTTGASHAFSTFQVYNI